MSGEFLKVEVSAETQEQADSILNALLAKKLVTGGQIISAPSRFWWKNEVVDMDYFTINSFTLVKHKEAIIEEVSQISVEEVPMIIFLPIDGNENLLAWIKQTVTQK